MAPKKTNNQEGDENSPRYVGLSNEDQSRMHLMEDRINILEDALAKSRSEADEARMREMAMMGLVRDMIGHIAASESGRLYILTIANYANSPTEAIGSPAATTGHSPRVLHLLKSLDNLARAYPPEIYHSNIARQPTTMPYTPAQPQSHQSFLNAAYNPAFSGSSVGGAAQAQASPHTDGTGSRGSLSGPSTGEIKPPASSSRLRAASNAGVVPPGSVNASVPVASQPSGNPPAGPVAHVDDPAEDVIEIPNQMQDMYGGESVSIAPLFVETPAWLTEGTTIPLTMYRKQSDGQALKAVYQAFAAGGKLPAGEGQDEDGNAIASGSSTSAAEIMAGSSQMGLQQSYGAGPSTSTGIPLPMDGSPSSESSSRKGKGKKSRGTSLKEQRESKLKPHWAQTPRILVVEDDIVYRTLSKKFLQKFGCETETVENAQGAVDKMNGTKYDLVLMDIFFGPNMDG